MRRYLLPLVILLVGIFLRSYSLSNLPNGLHWDEMDTGYQAYSLFLTGKDYFGNVLPLFPHSMADWRTPVYIYSAVVSVKALGLTAVGVRLPSVIFGSLNLILMYILAARLFGRRVGVLSAVSLALSIWAVQYSRQSVETVSLSTYLLLGINLFYKGLKRPKFLPLSSLIFVLASACYAPGKLFTPLFVLSLLLIYWKVLKTVSLKIIVCCILIFAFFGMPIYWQSTFGPAGTRFHDLSILTDPVLSSDIDYARLTNLIKSGVPKTPGLSPRLVDKLMFNKPVNIATNFVSNYLQAFSTEYLFTKGDQELRHSPDKTAIGMLFLTDSVFLAVGLLVLRKPEVWVWLLLGPVSAALTRDGGAHAARTMLMLPAFILFIAVGMEKIFKFNKLIFTSLMLVFAFNVFWVYGYYFNTYRGESARPFMWSFYQAVQLANANSPKYPQVYVDMRNDTLLMAYLFYNRYDPRVFQASKPVQHVTIFGDVEATQFGNIYLLSPGEHSWLDFLARKTYTPGSFVIADFSLPNIERIDDRTEYDYPDTTPAFYTFVR